MSTELSIHRVFSVSLARKTSRGGGTHWMVLIVTNQDGEECEVTMFHDGKLQLRDAETGLLLLPSIPLQSESGSALPRPGSDPDSSAGVPHAGQTRTISGSEASA